MSFSIANGIEDPNRKHAILNATGGPDTYKLAYDLLAPVKPKDSMYADIIATIFSHYTPINDDRVKLSLLTQATDKGKLDNMAAYMLS